MNRRTNEGSEGKYNTLKMAQLNLQNSRLCINELRKTMIDEDIDFLMAQEPYSVRGKVAGFGLAKSNTILGEHSNNDRPYTCFIIKPTLQPSN